jgi:hypothetical protein
VGKMTDRAAVFCALLTAMGVAAPSVTHAADVQADVTKVRDVRAQDKSFDNDRALIEATTFKFDKENLLAQHADD